MEDINYALLQDNIKITWLKYMESFGLHQIIESPTRGIYHSRTLIDHIYCYTPNNGLCVNVPNLGLSDHFPIFVTRKINILSSVKNSHFKITYRSFKNINEEEFCNDLKSIPWDIIKLFDDTNIWMLLINIYH